MHRHDAAGNFEQGFALDLLIRNRDA